MPADATGAMLVAEQLRARRPEILIAFGGTAAPDPDAATASASTIRLPAQIGEALAALIASLPDDRASPRPLEQPQVPRLIDRTSASGGLSALSWCTSTTGTRVSARMLVETCTRAYDRQARVTPEPPTATHPEEQAR